MAFSCIAWQRRLTLATLVLVSAGIAVNCGGSSSDDSSSSGDTAANAMTYPLGLSLAIAPQTNTATGLIGTDSMDESAKVKNEEARQMINGEAETCFPRAMKKEGNGQGAEEKCYQFDSEMIYIKDGSGNFVNGTKTGTAVTVPTEACMVTYTRNEVKQITSMVDRMMGRVQMMLCQSKKSGQAGAPRSDGGEVDFKNAMDDAVKAGGKTPENMPVANAKMTKVGESFVTEIEAKVPSAPNTPPSATDPTEKITMTHKPTNAENTEYEGSIVIRRDKDFDGSSSMARILTISYVRSAGRVKYRLLTARMNKAIAENAVVDGVLNLNAGTNSSGQYLDPATGSAFPQQNDGASAIMAIAFNMDPDTNAGNFSYWKNPGGSYDEMTRGFVFKMDADATTGLLSGCSSSGAYSGGSIRKAMKLASAIAPDKSYHPFGCGSGNCSTSKNSPASDSDGSYYAAKSSASNMYVPTVAGSDAAVARDWSFEQQSSNVAVQCFSQGTDGVYGIATTSTPNSGTAGFELRSSSATTLPPAPDLTGVK